MSARHRRRFDLTPLALLGAMASVTVPAAAFAQCRVPASTNEAKLLAYYAVPLAFSPGGVLEMQPPGSVRAAVDVTVIPEPSDALRNTNRCFRPKSENTQLSPVFPRPRFAVGLPGGVALEASYLPPVSIADAKANLASFAVSVVRPLRGSVALALRGHLTTGSVQGPITCPKQLLQQVSAQASCYGTAPSKDTYRPNVIGVEGGLSWTKGGRASAYVAGGWSSLKPRFQVGFQQSDGVFDSTRVETDLTRWVAIAGARYRISGRSTLMGEVYSVPQDVTVVRLGASYRLR